MKPTEMKASKIGARLPQLPPSLNTTPPRPMAADQARVSRARAASNSSDFETLSADLEKLTLNEDGAPRPNPVELPSPINPEGGRKQSVETHRNLFCGHYDSCLDEAVKHGWNSFTCVRCTFYQAAEEETAGVDRFATQRKAS